MFCRIGVRLRLLPLLRAVSIDDYRLQSPLVETEIRVCHHVKKKDARSGVCLGLLDRVGWGGCSEVLGRSLRAPIYLSDVRASLALL